jgi:endoglucanase
MKGDFRMRKTRRTTLLVGLAALAIGLLPVLAGAGACNSKSTFYVPKADTGATQQIVSLTRHHDFKNAALLQKMIDKGHAVWFTSGTPKEVQKAVKKTMWMARAKRAVPVLVAYDLPFRDCGQYSAGGALNTADYLAWIDGLAKGIGNGKAILILEPDGLGIIPYNGEWCQPDLTGTGLTPATANQARYDQLNGAVDRLEQQPNVSVYLDGTHSNWLGVDNISQRLVKAGVNRAEGFFLNVSNYQYSANLVQYGTWISQCIATGSTGCANIYWNGGPAGTKIADLLGAWQGVSLSSYGEWSDTSTNSALNTSGINAQQAGKVGTTHFVIDTSRNGLGPWDYSGKYTDAGTAQDWCNPPGRGVGIAPTTNTGNALVDAYLWLKVPGESDGSCNRSVAGSTTDPEWGGIVDPVAGAWFPQMALQLAQNANPVLK